MHTFTYAAVVTFTEDGGEDVVIVEDVGVEAGYGTLIIDGGLAIVIVSPGSASCTSCL